VIATIEKRLVEEMAHQHIPGISVAVGQRDQIWWAKGFGAADLENGVPVTPDSSFRIASISKTLTATAVMQLAESGKLDLDHPIQEYCPSFPKKPWPITARELLAHLSGIRHYNDQEYLHSNTLHFTSIVDSLALFKNDDLLFEPGTQFLYSTYGFVVLGCAVEGASGRAFLTYLKSHIIEPAGMSRTGADDLFALIPHRAQGYSLGRDGALHNSGLADTSNKVPGGGLVSTASDLVRFAGALLGDRLVSATSRGAMFTEQKTRSGVPTGYGLGWIVTRQGGRGEISHTGGQERVSDILFFHPETGVTVALLTNLEEAKTTPSARFIAETVEQALGASLGR
jgi:CubicO group peptidase (beta-lactamase class C family)